MKKPSILVVGCMNTDYTVYGTPRVARFGETLFCEGYAYTPGGKGANQAVAAAKLGADCTMAGRLGDDANGLTLIKNLERYGVDTLDIVIDQELQTGMATILVDRQTGNYVCYLVMGANNHLFPGQVELAISRKSYDMVLMQLEMPLETVYSTYELATARGIPVFLDAGPAMDIPLERLRGIFVISPNEVETKALTGIDPCSSKNAISAAKRLFERVHPKYVLLKLGARGALLFDGETPELIPCFSEVSAIDTTAAGDTFGAAFAVQYCLGANMRSAIRYAHAAAGLCVSRRGAQASIPGAAEVDVFLTAIDNT